PTTVAAGGFRWMAIGALGASLGLSAWALFPRLPSGRRGLVFWEDIETRPDVTTYTDEVARLTTRDIECEYASQNYFVSGVVHKKFRFVQWAIAMFLIGAGSAVVAYLAN